jgi:hypothetical protein
MTKAFNVVYLDPESVHFTRHGDTLGLTHSEGDISVHYPRVVLRSCFPVSDGKVYLSVRDANDGKQTEIGIIEDWSSLLPEDRAAVSTELNLHYFVPKIQRILSISEELGFLYWSVETDKGPQDFVMRNSVIRYARQIKPGHWLLIDVNDARHEIMDIDALDRRSQKLLEQYLSV